MRSCDVVTFVSIMSSCPGIVHYGDSHAKYIGIEAQKVGRLAPNFPVTNPEDKYKGIEDTI